MSTISRTPGRTAVVAVSPYDLALSAKALMRDALGLYGVSRPVLARMLGLESKARIDAALDDLRDNQVPLWWLLHPAFPAQVRAHLVEALSRAAVSTVEVDVEPERQILAALTRVGTFTTTAAATLQGVSLSRDAAAQLLRVVEPTQQALSVLASQLRARLDSQTAVRAGGAS